MALEFAPVAEGTSLTSELSVVGNGTPQDSKVAEDVLVRLFEVLGPAGERPAEERFLFPEGIRELELSIKAQGLEISLKLGGGTAPSA